MKYLCHTGDRPFTILNVTDIHAKLDYFTEGNLEGDILRHTVKELTERCRPDLITFTGDMTTDDDREIYRLLAEYIDSFDIPWAPVLGNHDNQLGDTEARAIGEILMSQKNCLFDVGDPVLGCGNYTVGVKKNGKPLMGLLFMDTHDTFDVPMCDRTRSSWGEITKSQEAWYREKVAEMKKEGFDSSLLFVHVPLYQYTSAAEEIFTCDLESSEEAYFDYPESYIKKNDAFLFGINYEGPSAPLRDNGFFDVLAVEDHTRHVLCGHNHVNTSSVNYRGIRLTYGLKTGVGSYRRDHLNGGTVIEITDGGFNVRHEYVNADACKDK
ncbi:MAG: metallophosphoesterase [Clostridia bacterium]|nr:metallophosphoesterase [Clostridia bacterium]